MLNKKESIAYFTLPESIAEKFVDYTFYKQPAYIKLVDRILWIQKFVDETNYSKEEKREFYKDFFNNTCEAIGEKLFMFNVDRLKYLKKIEEIFDKLYKNVICKGNKLRVDTIYRHINKFEKEMNIAKKEKYTDNKLKDYLDDKYCNFD